MKFLERNENIRIDHALSSNGEFQVGKYSLDGIDHINKVIYEFYGCW